MTINAPASSRRLTAHPCAKINLTLDVLGRRTNGFHEIRSLVVGVDLRDTLTFTPATTPGIHITCSDPALVTPDNLAVRAALTLARSIGIVPAIKLHLEKRIPVGGGMGGGSSDAAAALRLCNHIWHAGLGTGELSRLGAQLGSDIPLFFQLPAALVTGRGEFVEPVSMKWRGWVLLAFAGTLVPTADVYRAYTPADGATSARGQDVAVRQASTAAELSTMLGNDLESAVFRVSPSVARVRDRIHKLGVGPMRVSGAGSTLFCLFDEELDARRTAGQLNDHGIAPEVAAAPTDHDHLLA